MLIKQRKGWEIAESRVTPEHMFFNRRAFMGTAAGAAAFLSAGAAYGVLTLVFGGSWAEGLLDFTSTGAIASWLPMLMFVVLFGLSMDYHVFVLSRVREAYDAGRDPRSAVQMGVARSAGVVTSAAAVMVGVFSVFGTLSSLEMKQLGVCLLYTSPSPRD